MTGKTSKWSMAARCGWLCRSSTSIRAPSGSMASSSWSMIDPVSGNSAATIITLTPGKRSATGSLDIDHKKGDMPEAARLLFYDRNSSYYGETASNRISLVAVPNWAMIQAATNHQEGAHRAECGDVARDQQNADTSTDMPDTIHQGKAGSTRSRGIVLRRPRPGHRHKQVKADEQDDRADDRHPEISRPAQANDQSANNGEYRRDGQPVFAFQRLTIAIGKDGTRDEAEHTQSRHHTCLRRWIA